jgi:hypothetical protein
MAANAARANGFRQRICGRETKGRWRVNLARMRGTSGTRTTTS